VTTVVVDAESVQMTDTDGADILIQVGEELRADGTRLVFARVHPPILELWRRAGVPAAQDGSRLFETVRDAVATHSRDGAAMTERETVLE
jgi:MFS superfamily sulfate permease-like transporter